jgi:hypothetical protein
MGTEPWRKVCKMKLYGSAYPGSMFEKPTGEYIHIGDIDSLMEVIQMHLSLQNKEIEDCTDALKEQQKTNIDIKTVICDIVKLWDTDTSMDDHNEEMCRIEDVMRQIIEKETK